MKKNKEAILSIIRSLSEAGALPHVILVGSWAEFLYQECSVFTEGKFLSIGETTDADFLIKNLRVPTPPISVVNALTGLGYSYDEDSHTNCSKFFDEELEIEFLICQRGSGVNRLELSHLGVRPQEVTHMEIALRHTITVDFEGYKVTLPTPEAYVLQKMIINHKRGLKKEADRTKIEGLIPFINMDEFRAEYNSLYPKEKARVLEYIKEVPCGIYEEDLSVTPPESEKTGKSPTDS